MCILFSIYNARWLCAERVGPKILAPPFFSCPFPPPNYPTPHLKLLSDVSPTIITTSSNSLRIPIGTRRDLGPDNADIIRSKYVEDRDGTDRIQRYISPSLQTCELHVVIKHPAALPETDVAEGDGALITDHPLSSQAVPSTVSPRSPPTASITKFGISQNVSGFGVVQGLLPDAGARPAPSVPATQVCTVGHPCQYDSCQVMTHSTHADQRGARARARTHTRCHRWRRPCSRGGPAV